MLPPSARAMLRSSSQRTRAPRAKRLCLRLIGALPASGAPRCSQGEPARQLRESCRARDAGNQAPIAARQQTGSRVPAARRRPERSALFLPTARSILLSSSRENGVQLLGDLLPIFQTRCESGPIRISARVGVVQAIDDLP